MLLEEDLVTDWRKEYEQYTNNPRDISRLREGAVSLASSWHMQAMYNKWMKIKGIKYLEPPNCQSSLKEWEQSIKKYKKE